MNYLAHLYLADESAESVIGNMLADFVKDDFREKYSDEVCRGILLHRKIDVFTDAHPVFIDSRNRLDEKFRLLKGIIIDVFYDHFLARNWEQFSAVPLEQFCSRVYAIFHENRTLLPQRLLKFLPRMISENWLLSYREVEGISWTLRGLSNRLSRKNRMAESVDELIRHYDVLQSDFMEFFPQVIEYVQSVKLADRSLV